MAQTLQSLLLLLLSLFLMTMHTTTVGGGGFHLDLIHRFSPRSPFYPGHNLTKSELARELLHLSRSRISALKRSINTTTIRPPVLKRDGLYLVAVAIGTAEGMHYYYLQLDTGSALTWTQCVPCDPCFPQTTPMFDPILSPTFRLVPCNDPLCVPPYYRCEDEKCKYTIYYADDSSVSGIAARDTFTFLSSEAGHSESVPGLAFGCTHSSTDLVTYKGDPAGILGLDASPESFMTQVMGQTGGRFSYCLSPNGPDGVNSLRFGDDIVLNGPVQRTPFTISDGFYYLTLLDIGVNNKPVNVPVDAFARRDNGSGGSIIDSGTGVTRLSLLAYDLLDSDLREYFDQFGLVEVDGKEHGLAFELCYKLPSYFDSFPSMTFYLQGAELRVEWEQVFYVDEDAQVFCLIVLPDDEGMTTIGAYQQADTRFVYDVVNRELLFVPENCAQTH